ncbi:MAG: T9SS type A sorting domain-containing protein [Bacteroidota bacterium]
MYLLNGRTLRHSFYGLLIAIVCLPTLTYGQSSISYERLLLPASSAASGGVNDLLLHTATADVWLLGETFVGFERSGLLLQLDTLGQLRSGQRWGTPGDQFVNAEAIIELDNGDLLVAGNVRENVAGAQQQILLLRFGADGAFKAQHRFGTLSALDLRSVAELPNGNWLLLGNAEASNGTGGLGTFVVVMTPAGVIQSARVYSDQLFTYLYAALPLPNGNLWLSGVSIDQNSKRSGLLVQLGDDGSVVSAVRTTAEVGNTDGSFIGQSNSSDGFFQIVGTDKQYVQQYANDGTPGRSFNLGSGNAEGLTATADGFLFATDNAVVGLAPDGSPQTVQAWRGSEGGTRTRPVLSANASIIAAGEAFDNETNRIFPIFLKGIQQGGWGCPGNRQSLSIDSLTGVSRANVNLSVGTLALTENTQSVPLTPLTGWRDSTVCEVICSGPTPLDVTFTGNVASIEYVINNPIAGLTYTLFINGENQASGALTSDGIGITTSGVYQVEMRVIGECGETVVTQEVTVGSTATVSPDANPYGLIAYPNPTQRTLRLKHLPNGKYTYRIYDQLGREVANTTDWLTASTPLDFGSLPAGHYFLRLVTEAGRGAGVVSFVKRGG